MVKWLKRLWCWLTGGHLYRTIELQTHRIPEKGVTCFIHRCVKCGEYQVYAVNDSALYYGTPLYDEKINLRKKDGDNDA